MSTSNSENSIQYIDSLLSRTNRGHDHTPTLGITPLSGEYIAAYIEIDINAFKEQIQGLVNTMGDFAPPSFSPQQIDDITTHLTSQSSSFNKIWLDQSNNLMGVLACVENELRNGERDLFVAHLLYNLDTSENASHSHTKLILFLGNLKKLIVRAQKMGFSTLTYDGSNPKITRFLKRIGFHTTGEFDNKIVQHVTLKLNQNHNATDSRTLSGGLSEHALNATKLKAMVEKKTNRAINAIAWEIIAGKYINYVLKTKSSPQDANLPTITDAIAESIDALLGTNMGIQAALLEHQKQNARAARELRVKLAGTKIPSAPEIIRVNNLHLYELVNAKQLQNESANMDHCIGRDGHIDSHLSRIKKGECRYFSLRDTDGTTLITLEFDTKTKTMKQMKKHKDELLNGSEPWFEDFLALIASLRQLTPPIIVHNFKDTNAISKKTEGEIIGASGKRFASYKEFLEGNERGIFVGVISLFNEMSDQEITALCQISGVTIIATNLSSEKKAKVIKIEGNLEDTSSTQFENLISIEGNAHLPYSKDISFPSLKKIGGDAYFPNSNIQSMPLLETIGGSANFSKSSIKNLSMLKEINGNALFSNSKILNLSSLQTIGGDAHFDHTEITSLPSLQRIGGLALISHSNISDVSALQYIGGDVSFVDTKIKNLPKLRRVSGTIDFYFSRIKARYDLKADAAFINDAYVSYELGEGYAVQKLFFKIRRNFLGIREFLSRRND